MRRLVFLAVAALAAVPAALAAGPSPGVMQGGNGVSLGLLTWTAVRSGGSTAVSLRRNDSVVRTRNVAGNWGVPYVTYQQDVGGISRDGRTLVLAQASFPQGPLRAVTRFLVLDPQRLTVRQRIRLAGDFAYDALSPDGRTLFLVQHTSNRELTHYRVRAYDLRARRLLPRVIADKRQASWVMNGMPMARATGPGSRWQYTLYSQSDNYPFVHALDTVSRTAICVGIPWKWTQDMQPASLTVLNGKLVVELGLNAKRYVLDTRTLRLDR